MRLLLFFATIAISIQITNGQTDTSQLNKKQSVYGLSFHDATILVHTKQVENTRGASPKGVAFEISTLHSGSDTYKRWGFYSRNGVILSYFNFNTPILGSTYSAAYFLEPIFKLGNKAELRVKAAMGIGYLTNPNSNLKDSSATANFNYGSNLNAYLQVSVGASVHFTKNISGYISGNFNHNSNAGFAIPNRGVNYPSLSFGVLYHAKNNSLLTYKRVKDDSWKKNNAIQYYVGVFDAFKDGWTGVGIKYKKQLLIGATAFAAKRVSNVNAVTAGIEAYNDNTSSFFASVLLGNEFYLSKFILSQQLGYHLYKNTDAYNNVYLRNINPVKNFYQRYGIAYQLTQKYRIGFNFLARLDAADFFDFRLLYRIK
jgi:hypothetical protein